MTAHLTPAEIRTGQRLRRIYREADAHILAEEQATDALMIPTGADLVAARADDLVATPETRARYTAFLDRLEVTHGTDRWMRPVIDEGRARLAEFSDDREHPGSAPDGDPPQEPVDPDHTPPADITPSTSAPEQEAAA